jgi:hypothetical protein
MLRRFKSLLLAVVLVPGLAHAAGDVFAGNASTTIDGKKFPNIFLLKVDGRRLTGTLFVGGVARLPVKGSVSAAGRFRGAISTRSASPEN